MLAVLDYGIGNVRSVLNALGHIGVPATLTHDPHEVERAHGLILPGVGAFGAGMERIGRHGLEPLLKQALTQRKPVLGICLGFELLMRCSAEQGHHDGIGIFPLAVQRLPTAARLPHIGWTRVKSRASSPRPCTLMHGLEGESFYFVHSYGVLPDDRFITATADYHDVELVAVIEHGAVFGAQFHPEKSGPAGLEMLRNFAALTR